MSVSKYDFNKSRRNRQKQKKTFFPVTLKDSISNTNPNKIELRMLQEGLKYKRL